MVEIPSDRQIWESTLATYWFLDGGILVSRSKNTRRTVEGIAANAALVKSITGNTPVPLLIYISPSPVPDRATRRFSARQLPLIYKAMAMVAAPGLSQFIMNLLFRMQAPPIPMKSFTDDRKAITWLQAYTSPQGNRLKV